ncbi:MAG: hypothetical protein RLZZ08_1861 [Pseudomonadota bacterium]|jgi:FAD/FMN-containing dehydrogenase
MASPSLSPSAEYWPRGSAGFDAARSAAIWNRRLQKARSPEAILRCTDADQVAQAILHARHNNQRISLRGSGHSYIAAPLRDDGLLLDLGGLDFVEIDITANTARVGPGVRGGALIHALAHHGRAFPIGHCSTVAMGGYLLSGGIGWNCGAWGPACIHVRAVEVVSAAGERIIASETENPDLLWAARGGGCRFPAAVVAFHLELLPQPATARLWTASFTAASAPVLADWLNSATAAADPAAEVMCLVGPDLHSGQPSITLRAVCTGDNEADAGDRIASFLSPPAAAEATGLAQQQTMDFTDLTRLSAMPDDKRVAAEQCWSDHGLGDLLLAVQHLAAGPDRSSTINLVSPGGMGRIPHMPLRGTGALSLGGGVSCGIYAMWDHEADDARHLDWVRQADAALSPYRSGRYVGEADLTAPGRLADCFTHDARQRLEGLCRQWDSDRLFHGWPDLANQSAEGLPTC